MAESTAPARRVVTASPDLPSRIPSLDGLRAVAIGCVIASHLVDSENVSARLAVLQHLGNMGVRTFFIISGFLITTLLLKEQAKVGRISLKEFYLRRVLRIFPAFYLYVGIIGILAVAGVIRLAQGDLFHALTYTANYHHERAWYLNHIWSLSVEEQFYLLWPAVLVFAGTRRGAQLALAVLFLTPLIRAGMWASGTYSLSAFTREFQAVADSLATGCLLAAAYNSLANRPLYLRFIRSPLFWVFAVLGLILPVALHHVHRSLFYIFGQSIANLVIAMCVDRVVRFPAGSVGRVLNCRGLGYVGILSYSLYLWQEPFLNPSVRSTYTAFPQNLAFTLLVALFSYYLVERPFLRLKVRHSRSTPAGGSGQPHGAIGELLPAHTGRGMPLSNLLEREAGVIHEA